MLPVDVELRVVPGCPNESVALSVLRVAFDRVGLAALSGRTTVIASQEQAQERVTPAGLSGVPPLGDVISALTAGTSR
jgi:hypothetical protein